MRLSYKDAFDLSAKPLGRPLTYDVPSQIKAAQRQVEVLPAENGLSVILWRYEDDVYQEEYTLRIRLDEGAVPQPDGTGVVSNGHAVTLRFYERVKTSH